MKKPVFRKQTGGSNRKLKRTVEKRKQLKCELANGTKIRKYPIANNNKTTK
jgi:hypothetical protein